QTAAIRPDFANHSLALKKHNQPAGRIKELNGVGIKEDPWKAIWIAFHNGVVSKRRWNCLLFGGFTPGQPAFEQRLRLWCSRRNTVFFRHTAVSVCAPVVRQPDASEIVRIKAAARACGGFVRPWRRLVHGGSILAAPNLGVPFSRQYK